ncbi:hypothetical protein TNCV_4984971 [Trichonephila clavipes]|nr:hypothetical protein TNCV_4984971 [Trichonephila clavipes]
MLLPKCSDRRLRYLLSYGSPVWGYAVKNDRWRRRRLFQEGWEKKIDHDVKFKQITKTPTKTGRKDVPQSMSALTKQRAGGGRERTQDGRRDGRRLLIKSVKNHPEPRVKDAVQCS